MARNQRFGFVGPDTLGFKFLEDEVKEAENRNKPVKGYDQAVAGSPGSDTEPLPTLAREATGGLIRIILGTADHLTTWLVAYPALLFINVILFRDLFDIFSLEADTHGVIRGLLAGAAALYFLYFLLVPVLVAKSDWFFYLRQQGMVRAKMVLYTLILGVFLVDWSMSRSLTVFFSEEFFFRLVLFCGLFCPLVVVLKYYFRGLSPSEYDLN